MNQNTRNQIKRLCEEYEKSLNIFTKVLEVKGNNLDYSLTALKEHETVILKGLTALENILEKKLKMSVETYL